MRCDGMRRDALPQGMNSFVYMLEGEAAIGPSKGAKDQIGAHNTVTLTKVLLLLYTTPRYVKQILPSLVRKLWTNVPLVPCATFYVKKT